MVNKAIKTKVNMFVAQLEQYRQSEEEERNPGPSSVEADHLGVEFKQEISYPDEETSHFSKAKAKFEVARTKTSGQNNKRESPVRGRRGHRSNNIARKKKDLGISLNLITLQLEAEQAEVELEILVEYEHDKTQFTPFERSKTQEDQRLCI